MADVLSRYVLPRLDEASAGEWERIDDVSDDELWRAREHRRGRLALHIRARLRATGLDRGQSPSELEWCDERPRPEGAHDRLRPPLRDLQACDAAALAARAAAQPAVVAPSRCSSCSPARRTPPTTLGKALIRRSSSTSRAIGPCATASCSSTTTTSRVARYMYQGCDVWLNNPRRPQEACGTSGMKAALNGALNCSILDGWWDELFDGKNGWAITSAESETDIDTPRRDRGEQPLRAARAPDRAALLPASRRTHAAAWVAPDEVVAAHALPRGHRRSHGARLRHPALRTDREPRDPHRRERARGREGAAGVEGAGRPRRGRASASSTSSPMAVPRISARCARSRRRSTSAT